ncbi:hypothetical protein AB0F77_06250 [Streptomyces sp. NPDC026672]|uniref:hypothetical protein n=1 Tax=unclassified Streptomyces TaxID=2593676 RepID=UPI0033CD34BB
MTRLKDKRWTLVQHSAYVAKQDPRFQHQVEQVSITTEAELGRVLNLGGLVFDSYMAADDAVDDVNNPTGPDGQPVEPTLTFHHSYKQSGLPLYIAPKEGAAP